MKVFQIEKVNNSEYKYIILSTCYINPLDEMKDIESSIKDNFQGKVLFDMLLKNGLGSNRFVEAEFDGKKFILSSFKTLTKIDKHIREFTSNFYREHEELLDNSVLPRPYRYLIRKGKVI